MVNNAYSPQGTLFASCSFTFPSLILSMPSSFSPILQHEKINRVHTHTPCPPPRLVTSVYYFQNSTRFNNDEYQDCVYVNQAGIAGHEASVCCATNRKNSFGSNYSNGATANNRLPNGLCLNIAGVTTMNGTVVNTTRYRRGLCTFPG